MTDNGMGWVHSERLGDIQVYREFKPTTDAIEYTVYYRVNGKKHRYDTTIYSEELPHYTDVEEYVLSRIENEILGEIKKMREVPKDDQFGDLARAVAEKQSKPEPTEAELVIIALLMRIYDLNLALLSHFDAGRADEIYDRHNEGGHFNPLMFLPALKEDDGQNVNDVLE